MSQKGFDRAALQRLLDLSFFAPLGFALEREDLIPELAKAGRRQVEFSRSLGRAALSGVIKGMKTKEQAAASGPTAEASETEVASTAALPDYASLSARELIAFISTCTDEQAAWLRDQESSGKQRVTVLRALDARDG